MSVPDPNTFEKLGTFYLGREYDVERRTRLDNLLLYDSKDLVTHAVCVGMTGSGKTGLCLSLLEEAAIDGVPAIVIDPKGDLTNLLLTFPNLEPADFRPWINEEDARRKGVEPEAFAAAQANIWAKGLADWGQSGDRIRRLQSAAEFVVYTPGSNVGRSVGVLKGFSAPSAAIMEDAELYREHTVGTATSLLAILGLEADAQSRECTFLCTVLNEAWSSGKNLDLAALIANVQKPGFTKLGLMELETVYPAKERFSLAMAINNLAASPGFGAWMEGEPLDIGAMLRTPQGTPRIVIFSIAHLSDSQRMFFVSILLNQMLAWVRTQSGTGSLRALLYMDEIAGYFPPVANPPSKQPLLTLMKQARAFGVGVVLATQNPVDLDYKGLSNAGTWFIGRLQTDRDKQRVLDGLEGASSQAGAKFDRAAMDRLLSSLGPRIFLMNNVHENAPAIFETRWCMSYLRGPLTREQIRTLTKIAVKSADAPPDGSIESFAQTQANRTPTNAPVLAVAAQTRDEPSMSTRSGSPQGRVALPGTANSTRPVLAPGIPQYFLPLRANTDPLSTPSPVPVSYRPTLLGLARIYYQDAKSGVDETVSAAHMVEIGTGPVGVDWEHAIPVELNEKSIEPEPGVHGTYGSLPADAQKAKSYENWKKTYAEHLARSHTLELSAVPTLKLCAKPGESERDFRSRLSLTTRELRDQAIDKLRSEAAPKVAAIEERIRRAQQQVQVQRDQARSATLGTAASVGSAIFGALLGRKTLSAGNVSRAASAFKGVTRSNRESGDVARAEENVEALVAARGALERELQAEADELAHRFDPANIDVTRLILKPKKSGVTVRAVCLVWEPMANGPSGEMRAW